MCLPPGRDKRVFFAELFSRGTALRGSLWDGTVPTALPASCPTHSVSLSRLQVPSNTSLSQALLLENLTFSTGNCYPHCIDEEVVVQGWGDEGHSLEIT